MNLYWGDLHAHCAVSYGHGTARRAVANARGHLDFCSVTAHAFWPDMPQDLAENDATMTKHYGGFEKARRFWPSLLSVLDEANRPGEFVTFPSYEWHSMRFGDHNAYVAGPRLPLLDADSPAGLAAVLREAGCEPLVLPHHVGYGAGFRGVDWASFDPARSPLVEIHSNHGCSEADDAPYPYHHNMGPRGGRQTAREALVAGHRFGFQAGTDTHDGYPGHYGHGRVGVYAASLDRAGIWEALRARRTIASTGAAILIDATLGGAGSGEVAARRDRMDAHVRVEGTDTLTRVEWILGGPDGWTILPVPVPAPSSRFEPGRYKVAIQTGWGRHGTCSSWEVRARIRHGSLRAVTPYFRYSGHGNDEDEATERLLAWGEDGAEWTCRALAVAAGGTGGTHHDAGGPQTVLLEIDATAASDLTVETGDVAIRVALPDLARRSESRHRGGLSSPAIHVGRAVPEREFTAAHRTKLAPAHDAPGFAYLRVLQADGQAAWASPVFID